MVDDNKRYTGGVETLLEIFRDSLINFKEKSLDLEDIIQALQMVIDILNQTKPEVDNG